MSTNNPNAKGPSTLVRPLFGPGMLLQHEDLESLNNYTRDLSRLLFRSFFGCGVICGLTVESVYVLEKVLHIKINPGVALDSLGDPIQLPKEHTLKIGEHGERIGKEYWIILCRTTKCCAPRSAMCSDDDKPTSQSTRQHDWYELKALDKPPTWTYCFPPTTVDNKPPADEAAKPPENKYRCADPSTLSIHDHYEGKCTCQCNDDCDGGCECVYLGRVQNGEKIWECDYQLRRFIRPVFMLDPAHNQELNRKEEAIKKLEEQKNKPVAAGAPPA